MRISFVTIACFFWLAASAQASTLSHGDVQWEALSEGVSGPVMAMAFGPDGSLYVGGGFLRAGSQPARHIARWDGQAWHRLGSDGLDGARYLAIGADGTVYAAYEFFLRSWDGQAWHDMVGGSWRALDDFHGRSFTGLAVNPEGTLFAGGSFYLAEDQPQNSVAVWNGEAWSAIGGADIRSISTLAGGANGTLVTSREEYLETGTTTHIEQWIGEGWRDLGYDRPGTVSSLAVGPDGAVYAGGFSQGEDGITSFVYRAGMP